MKIITKHFNELSTTELYQIIKSRIDNNVQHIIDVLGKETKYNYITKMYVTENNIEEASNNNIQTEITCPKCNKGILVKRVASKGKNKGNEFYACNQFPKCKNILTIEEYNKLKK